MLDIHVCVSEVDYNAIIDVIMPYLSDALKKTDNVLLKTIAAMPPQTMGNMLKALPNDAKEQIISAAVAQSEATLIAKLKTMLTDKGITLTINSLSVKNQ